MIIFFAVQILVSLEMMVLFLHLFFSDELITNATPTSLPFVLDSFLDI
jgi:hypothetical protein